MNQAPEYQSGIEVEKRIIFLLGLVPSSQQDNIKNDIDARWEHDNLSLSIKCQHKALETGNLAFELETEDSRGNKTPSWFYTGRAQEYLIVVGSTLYRIDRNKLSQYIEYTGWDRVVGLTMKTQESQRNIGHSHVNARIGLISIKRLKKAGLVISESNLPF
jgi:hypothetical protein